MRRNRATIVVELLAATYLVFSLTPTGRYLLPSAVAGQAWPASAETSNLVRMRSQALGQSAPSLTASLVSDLVGGLEWCRSCGGLPPPGDCTGIWCLTRFRFTHMRHWVQTGQCEIPCFQCVRFYPQPPNLEYLSNCLCAHRSSEKMKMFLGFFVS